MYERERERDRQTETERRRRVRKKRPTVQKLSGQARGAAVKITRTERSTGHIDC